MKSTITQQVNITLSEQEVTEIIKQHLFKHSKELAPNCTFKWDDIRLEVYVEERSRNFSMSATIRNAAVSKEVVTAPIYNGV